MQIDTDTLASTCLAVIHGFVVAAVLSPCLVVAGETSPEIVLELSPGEGNPRNSEGDFVRLADGRLLFVYTRFTGGGGDHDAADLVSRQSLDGGRTWSEHDQIVVANESGWNVMSVSLLRLVDGPLALFYARKNSLTDCRPVVRFSTDEAQSWSDARPVIADDDVGYFVLNNDRVIQLTSGRLVVPVALHNRPDWKQPEWRGEITCYLSDDAGKTWRKAKTRQPAYDATGQRVTAQEPGVVELLDGRLLMWVRTNTGQQYRSFSSDGGETWSTLEPMGVPSPLSPASIERIPSTSDLLMVWNDHTDLPVSQRKARTPFTAAISRDEAASWELIRNLADDPKGWYCYTAIEFVDDHVLLAHVAGTQEPGKQLATTRITRVPIEFLYRPTESVNSNSGR